MCDVYREACSSYKMFPNGLNFDVALQAWVEETVHEVETHRLPSKEQVPGIAVSKEGHAVYILGHEKSHHYWFPWKSYNCFLLPTPLAKFTLFIKWTIYVCMCVCVYIYIYIYNYKIHIYKIYKIIKYIYIKRCIR